MHVQGHNPYITQQPGYEFAFNESSIQDFLNQPGAFDALGPYLEQFAGSSDYDPYDTAVDYLTQYGQSMQNWLGSEGLSYGSPYFQYQGISPEIMGALGNVFNWNEGQIPDVDVFSQVGEEGLNNLWSYMGEEMGAVSYTHLTLPTTPYV